MRQYVVLVFGVCLQLCNGVVLQCRSMCPVVYLSRHDVCAARCPRRAYRLGDEHAFPIFAVIALFIADCRDIIGVNVLIRNWFWCRLLFNM